MRGKSLQTFLPFPDFRQSAKVLDYRRLGKQRLEAYQLIIFIEEDRESWENHPARLMWVGYTNLLKVYLNVMIKEWISRGYKNTIIVPAFTGTHLVSPNWLGDERLHSSHRAALLAKNYNYYSKFEWKEKPKIDYYWPVRKSND